jgi:hypothetical protein
MTRREGPRRETRTSDIAGAAYYYAHGLRFSAFEMRSSAGAGGALNVNFVFCGGSELTALNDEFTHGNPDVTLAQITTFVALLSRRLRGYARREGYER